MAGRALPHHHVARATWELIAVVGSRSQTHLHLRNRLLAIFWVTLIATAIVFVTERHAAGTQIHNVFDAFLFSTAQLLTASSVAAPTTDAVKVLELFFDIYAITVVATLAGSFGAFFHRISEIRREHGDADATEAAARDVAQAEAAAER